MKLRVCVAGALLLGASAAAAGPRQVIDQPGDAPLWGFVGDVREDGLIMARQVLPGSNTPPAVDGPSQAAIAQSKVIYLHHTGITLNPGNNDSRTKRSSIVNASTTFAAWNVSATAWNETLTCMRELFARFDVTVTDTDPGMTVPH